MDRVIGLLVPAINATVEGEFHRVLPPEVCINTERMAMAKESPPGGVSHEFLSEMNADIERAARLAAYAPRVELIVYACTGGSFMEGPGSDAAIEALIEKATGVPALSTTSCLVRAFRNLGARRLSVVTPAGPWLNERFKVFLEASGFEVAAIETPGLPGKSSPLLALVPVPDSAAAKHPWPRNRQTLMDAIANAARPDADAVFVLSTGVRAIEVLDEIETRLGKPVVTANQVTIWGTLVRLGIRTPIHGAGALLRRFS